jgi:hypothetical protein
MDALNRDYYMETFRRHICSICKLCDSRLPAFCMAVYGGNPERFFEIVKYINVLRLIGKDDFLISFYSFEGFCGLFCNSQKKCPNRAIKCEGIDQVFSCYEAFADQCGGAIISKQVKADIWKSFSGIGTKRIGSRFQLPTRNPLKMLNKKQKRKLNKDIKRAKAGMRSDLQLTHIINSARADNNTKALTKAFKKKKPVKTTFFCNDDKDWQEEIDSILESKEN